MLWATNSKQDDPGEPNRPSIGYPWIDYLFGRDDLHLGRSCVRQPRGRSAGQNQKARRQGELLNATSY